MKGIILAGGKGTRLLPLTKDINKHLLPIGGKPMILHALDGAVKSGLRDLVVVYNKLGKDIPGLTKEYVKNNYPDLKVVFRYEKGRARGIASSIKAAREDAGDDSFVVIFADVLFQMSLRKYLSGFDPKKYDAKFLLSHAEEPGSHATVYFKGKNINNIIEKCEDTNNNTVITTYDIFSPRVWKYFPLLKPSARGELEITDLRNLIIQNGNVDFEFVEGWWIDVGTHARMKKAEMLLK
jgi:glucose-1-phosphate thymidylyltransferase